MSQARNERGQFVRTKPDYKALYEQEKAAFVKMRKERDDYFEQLEEVRTFLEFFIDHSPFWVRWAFNREFGKGGE